LTEQRILRNVERRLRPYSSEPAVGRVSVDTHPSPPWPMATTQPVRVHQLPTWDDDTPTEDPGRLSVFDWLLFASATTCVVLLSATISWGAGVWNPGLW
jgi:hypothetical protein